MPRVELEIQRTVTIEREETITVEVDVPQDVLDEEADFDLHDWVENNLKDDTSELAKTAVDWECADEVESYEITDVCDLGPVTG